MNKQKQVLKDLLKNDFNKLDKLFNATSYDDRMIHLKSFAKILCKGNDNIAKETRELIYKFLIYEFKPNRIKTYLSRLDENKKATELRQWTQILPKKLINELVINMETQKVGRG